VISTDIVAANPAVSSIATWWISAGEREAPHVLDRLLDRETTLEIDEHFVDTGGASDHVFGLFAIIGKRFAQQLRNVKSGGFHTIDKPDNYPFLKNISGSSRSIPH
jgi:TnpA family transposase